MNPKLALRGVIAAALDRCVSGSRSEREKRELVADMEMWSQDRVRAWQWSRIRDLLQYAQTHVPYYKRLFAGLGIRAADVRSWADFSQLPILTKEEIQSNRDRLTAPGIDAIENQTGGSTGQPLRFYQDREYLEWATISRSWGFDLCGFRNGDSQVVLWGSDLDSRWHRKLKGRIWDFAHNVQFVNVFNISAEELKQVARTLIEEQPDYIWAYASTLELLADQFIRDDLRLHPKAVQSTAGTLYPSLRSKLEKVFGEVIYDRYGCREVGNIAHECSAHQGLHVFSPHNYVEILEDDGLEGGRVIVTNLHNRVFPFIRYDIGDYASWADGGCECGRTFPLLQRVLGRSVEIITSPSGKLIDGEFFTHLFYRVDGVRQFQVVQESRERLVVKIVKTADFDTAASNLLRSKIKEYGDPGFKVKFDYVDYIPPLDSGKRAFVLSKVPVELS
ncbi:MAG: phenylacetate--CoA ligase family protein [bacterium]